MKYISEITSPDILALDYLDHTNIDTRERQILTIPEIAHFVRLIPFRGTEESYHVWSSPEFFMKLRKGSVVDHALLMASLFQGTMFDDHEDLDTYLKILADPNKKKRRAELAKFRAEYQKTPNENRVFVCLGRLNQENGSRKHAWVMTINRSFDEVTFWEPVKPVKYKLEGRINYLETEWLKNYLSPQLTVKEKKKFRQKLKKLQKQKQKEEEEKKKKEDEAKKRAETKQKDSKHLGEHKNLTMVNELLLKAREYQNRRLGKLYV